jgi:hypothetical protein
MKTVRSTPHPELAIAGTMTLVARVARATLAAIRSAVASQNSSPPVFFGRWSW